MAAAARSILPLARREIKLRRSPRRDYREAAAYFWLDSRHIQKIFKRRGSRGYVMEKNSMAVAVVEIFVRQHKGLGIFKFTKLPTKDDHLCLPSPRRGRLNRYVVMDVTQTDPQRMSENGAEPLHAWVYVSFRDEI
jgi:hypothetical protein